MSKILHIENKYLKDQNNIIIANQKIIKFLGIKLSYKIKRPELQIYLETLKEKEIEESEMLNLFYLCSKGNFEVTAGSTNYFNKFIAFSYDYIATGNKCGVNIGDYIQTIATKNIVQSLYPNILYDFWSSQNLTNYSGSKAFTIMQGWFTFFNCHTFLPNKNLYPIYIGWHLTENAKKDIIYFLKYNPNYFKGKTIGCRDEGTKQFFIDLGVDAYLSRCLTLTLPKRKKMPTQTDIFIVDIPQDWYQYIPKDIINKAKYINHRGVDSHKGLAYYHNSTTLYIEKTYKILDMYEQSAKLIITSALHCAAPCIAMGIPTILLVPDSNDTRYTALKNIIKIYTYEDLINQKVNFSPSPVNIEDLKKDLINNVKLTIEKESGQIVDDNELKAIRNRIENYNSK